MDLAIVDGDREFLTARRTPERHVPPLEDVAASIQPGITVSRLVGDAKTFLIQIHADHVERAIGPFTEEECRAQLANLDVPPAAIEARLAGARSKPIVA